MAAKFEVNRIYSCRLSNFDDGVFLFKVTARAASSITLQAPDRTEMTHCIFIAPNGVEAIRPHGACPLSPIMLAR